MPGRWVGGKGSRACPEKDSIFEAEVFQDDGSLTIRRLYSPGENGRFLLADFIAASDEYYRYWVETPEGRAAISEGNYHLCKVSPGERTAKSRTHTTIHLGKWRAFKREELTKANLPDYPKQVLGEIEAFFAKEGEGRDKTGKDEGLPWGEILPSPTAGPARLPKGGGVKAMKKKSPGEEPAEKKAEREKSKVKLTELQKELAALKKRVSEEEEKAGVKKPPKKKKRGGASPAKPAPKPFEAGLRTKRKGKPDGSPSESPGDSDDDEDESEDKESSEEPGESPERGKVERPRKGRRKGDDKSEDEEDSRDPPRKGEAKGRPADRKKRRRKKKKKVKEAKRKKDDGKKSPKKKERDRGPFGVARTEEWSKGESKESSSSSSSESDFHKASGEKSLQLKLVRYAQRHPGRLATRLLRLMAKAVGFSSGAMVQKNPTMRGAPATAHLYFLTVLTPALSTKWTAGTAREMKCWATMLDLLAEGKGQEAEPEAEGIGEVSARREHLEKGEVPGTGGSGRSPSHGQRRREDDEQRSGVGREVEGQRGLELGGRREGPRKRKEGERRKERKESLRECSRESRQDVVKPPQKKARKEKMAAPQKEEAPPKGGDQASGLVLVERKEEASPKGGGQASGLVLVEREAITQQQEGGKRLPPLEDEEEEMSGGDPVREQEKAEALRTDRRADFETKLKKLMENRVTIKEAAKVLMKIIPSLGTKLGRFYTLLEKAAVAPKELTAPAELLPISLKAIGRLKGPWDMDERAWIHWICWVLNFNFCTGWEKASNLQHPSELTTAQLVFIKERIYPAVKRLTEFNTKLPALVS